MCIYKYSFILLCWHVVFFHYVWFSYIARCILYVYFFVNDHFNFMNLKLQIKGSKKMETCIGTIVDLPFLCMKMAYCRKSLSCRLRNLKKATIIQELLSSEVINWHSKGKKKQNKKKLIIFVRGTAGLPKVLQCNMGIYQHLEKSPVIPSLP